MFYTVINNRAPSASVKISRIDPRQIASRILQRDVPLRSPLPLEIGVEEIPEIGANVLQEPGFCIPLYCRAFRHP
ncbi:MAG: hypothetical protein WB611_33850 [Stellaceae bacterium]